MLIVGLVSEEWATNVIMVVLAVVVAVQVFFDLWLGRVPETVGPTD